MITSTAFFVAEVPGSDQTPVAMDQGSAISAGEESNLLANLH